MSAPKKGTRLVAWTRCACQLDLHMALVNSDPKRKLPTRPSGTGPGSGPSGSDRNGPASSGPPDFFQGARPWLFVGLLLLLFGAPRLFSLADRRVSFDEFMGMVDKGQLKRVSFQVDTVVGEGSESGTDPKVGGEAPKRVYRTGDRARLRQITSGSWGSAEV